LGLPSLSAERKKPRPLKIPSQLETRMISTRIAQLTVPSYDNGCQFIRTDRLVMIKNLLAESKYHCLAEKPLAKVYCHQDFGANRPTILISCHIDSVYNAFFSSVEEKELRGTFDNSACNAIIVEMMLCEILPEQVLVSFTGDEEEDCKGVDQTIDVLDVYNIFDNLEVVIVLDLTEAKYEVADYTIENEFVEQENETSLLRFRYKRQFRDYLRDILDSPIFINDEEPDESWQYDEYDLNCFSFCLPCRLLGADMHEDSGVALLQSSIEAYACALQILTQAINEDLANRIIEI
jgi:hypothetical protein